MRKLSSSKTIVYKYILPILIGLIFVYSIYDAESFTQISIFIIIISPAILFYLMLFMRFKQVFLEDRSLIIKGVFEEKKITMAQIIDISFRHIFNTYFIVIAYKDETGVKKVRFLVPWSEYFHKLRPFPWITKIYTCKTFDELNRLLEENRSEEIT